MRKLTKKEKIIVAGAAVATVAVVGGVITYCCLTSGHDCGCNGDDISIPDNGTSGDVNSMSIEAV